MQYLILGNVGSKRWQAYSDELHNFWNERQQHVEIHLVPWHEVILADGNLDAFPLFDNPALVRIESPGRDFEVTKLLLQDNSLIYRKGLILEPNKLYQSFCRILLGLQQSFDARPHLIPLCRPMDVIEMFDKNATLDRLRSVDIPCPDSLIAPSTAGQLLTELQSKPWPTSYVKLSTGSSASGIAVVRANQQPITALTSVATVNEEFFNTRQVHRTEGDTLLSILQFILEQGSTVQQGIPMAQIDGQHFDMRVIVIHGQIEFTLFRLSPHPMTNLHLGGRRGEWETCRQAIPTRAWLDAMDHCLEVAELYPNASILGIDLVFERGFLHHYILEVNAFGDFFPGWTNEKGKTVHRVEIEATASRYLN